MNALRPGSSSGGCSTRRKLYSAPSRCWASVNETPRSKLKSLRSDDAQVNPHPIRRLYAASLSTGARDTQIIVTSRCSGCTIPRSNSSAANEQLVQPASQSGPNMKW